MFFTFLLAWLIAAVIIYLWCYIVEVVLDLPVTGQTPCTAHASLKNIIRRVLRDASNMAILKEPQNDAIESPDTTTNRTYEDLLATAILNKVIDNYQHDLRRSSSGSTSSRRSESGFGGSKRHKRGTSGDKETSWRHISNSGAADDTTSISSVEEWCRSESSAGEKYVDHLSFTIQQSIEEISTSDEDHPSNQYLHSHNLTRSLKNTEKDKNFLREDWQDNWMFSRKGKGSPKPVPVPMLVPNPSTDYRALIGDRDAEDTSDLSETGSDLDETDSVQDIKTILVDSRTVIGGKNLLENVNTQYLERDNVNNDIQEGVTKLETKKVETVEEGTNGDTGFEDDEISEARNNLLIDIPSYVESDSLGSNTEKDMEYTEKYASIPRQISKDKSLEPSPSTMKENLEQQNDEIVTQTENKTVEHGPNEDEIREEEPPVNLRGSYSEKEIQKWRNPVALTNNPYSKENLDKRLQEKSKSINGNNAFGRDYYIREAKRAAGGRKKFLDEDSNTENSVHDSDIQSLSLTSESSDQNIYTAVPILIEKDSPVSDENEEIAELHSLSASRPVSLALSTDSEDVDVKRVYNIETGKVYTYKNNITKEIIENSKSPEGTKFLIKPNELVSSSLVDEVDNKFDENHNKTFVNNQKLVKEPIMSISNHIIALTSEKNSQTPNKETVSKQEFLQKQISVDSEPEIEIITQKNETNKISVTTELKESSKKFLQSLIRNKQQPEVVNDFSTPPISLQENDKIILIENHKENGEINSEPLIEMDDDSIENTIDEKIEDWNEFNTGYKSCIDLRHINQDRQQSSTDNLLRPISHNGFTNSTPNLYDDKLYFPEDEIKESEQKIHIATELDELATIGKVKDLKKLFDNEKSLKATVSRTKSHLTTKPELKAHRQIHSLTARSLSKEFRQSILPVLQKTNSLSQDNSIEINDLKEEDNQDEKTENVEKDELKEIPPCKSKIEYFELLKNN